MLLVRLKLHCASPQRYPLRARSAPARRTRNGRLAWKCTAWALARSTHVGANVRAGTSQVQDMLGFECVTQISTVGSVLAEVSSYAVRRAMVLRTCCALSGTDGSGVVILGRSRSDARRRRSADRDLRDRISRPEALRGRARYPEQGGEPTSITIGPSSSESATSILLLCP